MNIHHDFPLSEVLYYKIGGKARFLLECSNSEDILKAFDFLNTHHPQKIFVCGLGTNLIFTDDYFDGAVIRIVDDKNNLISKNKDGLIEVFGGESLGKVIDYSFGQGLTGLEWAGGLPGTVGAGVRGNVGAFGGEMKDNIFSVDVLDYSTNNFTIKTLTKDDLDFVYRGSLIKTNKKMVVLTARFQLHEGGREEIIKAREICEQNINHRKKSHPLEYPNCGSVFKNIKNKEEVEKVLSIYPDLREKVETIWYGKVAVASLIERLGLKGYRIGDAQVSEKHALFIVNLGQAKAKDVLQIIQDIQDKFQETFGFKLEVEVEIVR